MKVGCCAYTYREYLQSGEMSLEDFVRTCYAIGLDGVELTEYYFPTTETGFLKRIKRQAFALGLDIVGTAIGGAFAVPDEPRAAHEAFARRWIDVSVALGAPYMRVFAGPVPDGHTEEEAVAWCIAGLKAIAPYAEERGVIIGLENHGGITSTAEQVLRIIEGVDSEWVRVNLDVGNYRGDPYREIEETVPYAVSVHAKPAIGGDRPLDYARVVHILRSGGFNGYMNIEFHAPTDTKLVVPRFAQYLKSLVAW